MIRECDVKSEISHSIPQLTIELSYIKNDNDVYKAIACFTNYTKTLIKEDEQSAVEECFNVAYHLLHEGNRLVQIVIENAFIFPISTVLEVSLTATQPVRAMFLKHFKNEYCKQINTQYP